MGDTTKETKPAVHLSMGGAAVVLIALQLLVMYAKTGRSELEAWVDCALPAGAAVGYAEAPAAVKTALLEKCERPAHASIRESRIAVRATDWNEENGREVRTITATVEWRPAKVGIVRWSRLDRRKTYAVVDGSAADGDG